MVFRLCAILLISLISVFNVIFAQDYTEDDLLELSETYSFMNPFIGEITVNYPADWMIKGDEAIGAIFMGENLELSDSLGAVVGTPSNIMVAGYPSEIDISEYDEELIFEVYKESILSGMNIDDKVEGTLIEINDQLMYYILLDLSGSETYFIFLHENGEFIAIQALTENHDMEILPIALSVAASIELNTSGDNSPKPILLDEEHTTTYPEGLVTFKYPSSWEVHDSPFDTHPVVVSNDIEAFIAEQYPPLGVYGIRISAHETSQNGLLIRQDGSFSPEEILAIVLGDEATMGLTNSMELENGEGISHAQVAGGYTLITAVFDTDDNLTVFMQAVARARDAGQLNPIFTSIADSFSFTPLD